MTQKLIESLEFSRGAGWRWCILLCNSGILTDNQLGYYLQNVFIVIATNMCNSEGYERVLKKMTSGQSGRSDRYRVRWVSPILPTWEWDTSGYKTIPREILCMTFCKLTGTLHIYGNSLNVHWKLFVQKFLLWSKSWLWCITSATFLWNLTKQEREGVPKKKLLFFWILSKLGGGRGGGPCPNLFGSFS